MLICKMAKNNKGTSMVVFAAALVVVLGCASIAVDVGLIVSEKSGIVNAVDAAALAGAQELIVDKDNAENVAKEFLQKNGIDPNDAEIEISEDGKSVDVTAKKEVNYVFARVFGEEKGEVRAKAVARTMPVSSIKRGVRPFAIEEQILHFGQQYTLKEGGGDGNSGNYGALALGGNGACNYKYNIIDGYDGSLEVGDLVYTEPGNMSGPTKSGIEELISDCTHSPKCTFDNYKPDCPRIISIIVVDSLDVNGRSEVEIVGFASFFLEGVTGNGNKSEVKGRFIKTITTGEISESQTDYGLNGIKLVN